MFHQLAQLVLPASHQPSLSQAEGQTVKIKVNQAPNYLTNWTPCASFNKAGAKEFGTFCLSKYCWWVDFPRSQQRWIRILPFSFFLPVETKGRELRDHHKKHQEAAMRWNGRHLQVRKLSQERKSTMQERVNSARMACALTARWCIEEEEVKTPRSNKRLQETNLW